MGSNKFCPNLSLPESKALINKLGLLGFYKEYIKNEYDIPTGIKLNNILNKKTSYQNISQKGIIASEKTIRDLAARLSDRIGIPIKFESDRTLNYKGKIENGVAYVNLAHATLDTPIHEILGHPIIRSIRANNNYQGESLLYNNLLKELETGVGKEVLDRIKKDYNYKYNVEKTDSEYGDYKINSSETGARYYDTLEQAQEALENYAGIKYTLEEQQEEALVELLGLMTANKLDNVKDGKLISLLKRLLKEMKAFVRSLLNQREVKIDNLPDNMTLGDLSDLLAYSNSKLILPGYEVEYTTPDNVKHKTYSEASNHVSKLAKDVKDVDLNKDIIKYEVSFSDMIRESDGGYDEQLRIEYFNTIEEAESFSKGIPKGLLNEIKEVKNKLSQDFISKNKQYEQSKEIIEEWKKVNNIKYNPEEVYSRGQEFVSIVGAYSDFDVNLMMQNLLLHIEDNEKAGGKFAISVITKPVDGKIKHLEGGGGKIKFKINPQSEDILWASNVDVYSGSVWDASSKVNKDKKSELLGVSYSKYPSLKSINTVQPNLANVIDDLAHHHNELGITLTGNNFRLEYDEDIPYSTKKIIDGVNKILDQKYGKLNKSKSELDVIYNVYKNDESGYRLDKSFNTEKEANEHIKKEERYDVGFSLKKEKKIIQPTQTNETLKESIDSVKSKINFEIPTSDYGWFPSKEELDDMLASGDMSKNEYDKSIKQIEDTKANKLKSKKYTSQALINTKIAALKEVAKKYPRSLIRSEVKKISQNYNDYNNEAGGFGTDELPFQKVRSTDNTQTVDNTESVKDKLFINIDLFSAKQEESVVNSLIYEIQQFRNSGEVSVETIFLNVLENMKETQKFYSQFEDDTEALRLARQLQDVIDNFDKFYKKSVDKLLSNDVRINNNVNEENNETTSSYDDVNNLFQKLNYSDDSTFSQSSKDTASSMMKATLSLIPKFKYENGNVVKETDENGKEVPASELNYLYLPMYEDLDNIWNDLLYTLIDVPIGSKLDYLRQSSNPKHQMIADQIDKNPNVEIKNQFESVFSKQQARDITISKERSDNSNNRSLKIFGTNRNNVDNLLTEDWYNSFLQSEFVDSSTGNLIVNTKKGAELNEYYKLAVNTLNKDYNKGLEQMQIVLGKLGIDISIKALKQDNIYIEGKKISIKDLLQNKLKYFFNRLSGQVDESTTIVEDQLEKNNPFITETSSISALAKLENLVNPSLFESSYISGDNKSKYSFGNNSFLSHKIRLLKNNVNYLKALSKTSYASTSYYLTQLINNPTFAKTFDMFYLDTIGNKSTNQVNKTFGRMNSKEKEFTRVSLFQNQGESTESKGRHDISMFIGLIPSDKTMIPIFKALNVNVILGNNGLFNSETTRVIYNQFISEYERVKQTQAENSDTSIIPIDGYHGKKGMGSKFLVFSFLNDVLFDEDGVLLELDVNRIEEIVKPKLESFLQNLVSEQIEYWKDLGIYNKDLLDKSFKSKSGIQVTELNKNITNNYNEEKIVKYNQDIQSKYDPHLKQLAASYAINQFIFMMNQTQIISGDPALHGKSTVNKTWINYFKRMAKDIAPGLDGNFEDTNFNTIFLKDLGFTSEQFAEYAEKVSKSISKAYGLDENGKGIINPADAQEYTTLQEHLTVMRAYGRLTQQQELAAANLLAGGDNIADIQLILQPVKPVYVQDVIKGSINKMYYIKTSSFPLIPALTKGLEIDKLRVAMENHKDSNGKSKPIQRAVFESGVKLGLQGKLTNLSNDGGNTIENINISQEQVITLPRSGFRIQQEIPYHGEDKTVGEATQGSKLILNNLEDNEVIEYNGREIKGSEAKKIFDDLHIEKMDRAFNQLASKLGFDQTLGKFKDITTLQKILQEEATTRNYPINDIYGIQVIEENGIKRFKVPISFAYSASKFESILNSLVTNGVIKGELPGFSKVQGSNVGFSKIQSDENLSTSIVANSIIWLNPKDTKLGFTKNSKGKLTGADILVPNYFKGVNLQDYVKADGTLNLERIPKELLTIIGIRIPTQGYSSMMKFNVKGFLPTLVGDLTIVPAELVAQMGSDFDVDKLYFYNYHYNTDSEGNLSKVKMDNTKEISELSSKEIDNGIVQMFEDRLSDSRLLEQILEPNGFGLLTEIASEILKLSDNKVQNHPFTTQGQNIIHQLNADGKQGTGIFSLFSTSIRVFQDAKITSNTKFLFRNSEGKIVSLNNLSSIDNIENKKKSNVVMYLQSASVDNSKEQLLGILNINEHTMGVAGTMAMLGLPEDFIGYFLSQPAIKEYVKRVANASDIISGEFSKDIQLETLNRLSIEANSKTLADNSSFKESNKDVNSIIYGVAELKDSLINNQGDNFNAKVIADFAKLLNISKEIQQIQSSINTGDKGLGTNLISVFTKINSIEKLIEKINGEFYPLNNVDVILNSGTIKKAIQILYQSQSMFGNISFYNTLAYNSVVASIFEKASLSQTEDNLKSVYDNIKSYLLASNDFLGVDNVDTLRDELLYSKKNNIAKRWLDYKATPEGKNNILTQRIKPVLSTNRIAENSLKSLNTPGSNNSSDINSSIMYFYNMLNSSNEVEAKLAEDTVKYFILTGAQYGPTSIGKYISYDALEKYDFSEKLRKLEDYLKNPANDIESFVQQYFQNNPFKAHSVNIENTTADSILISATDPTIIMENGNVATYIVSYDSDTSTQVLYAQVKSDVETETYEYTKLEILGNKLIKKYNYQTENVIKALEKSAEVDQNTLLSLDQKIDQKYEFDKGNMKVVLENIVKNSNNPYFVKMATSILNSNIDLNKIKLEYTKKDANGFFDSKNNVLAINQEKVTSTDKFEEIFLHESLHSGTSSMLEMYNLLKQSMTLQEIVKSGLMTREQIVAANNINKLYDEYVLKNNRKEDSAKFNDIIDRRKKDPNSITAEEYEFLRINKDELYPLYNPKEFIAAGLTNGVFTETLKKNNLWNKLKDFIANLLGINSTDLNALYENTFTLFSNSKLKGLNNQNNDVSITKQNYTENSPKEKPNTAYVFTENINSIGSKRKGEGSAIIRNNPNAIGIVTKKYYTYSENRTDFNKSEWNKDFQDTQDDFEFFKYINEQQFAKLDNFKTIIFPKGFASDKASIPTRFAEWLQKELLNRYGLVTELNSTKTGLISKNVNNTIPNQTSLFDNDINSSKSEYNRLKFIQDRDRFLSAYSKKVGQIVTAKTIEELNNSVQANTIYSNIVIKGWKREDGKIELRVSREDPVDNTIDYDIAPKPKRSEQEKLIDSHIERQEETLKNFKNKRKNLKDVSNPELDIKIKRLEDKIKLAKSDQSIINLIDNVELKLQEIEGSLKNIRDTDTLIDYINYLDDYTKLNDKIEVDNSIIDGLGDRFDLSVAKATKMLTKIRKIAADVVDGQHVNNLGYEINLKAELDKGLVDENVFATDFLDTSQSKSPIIQSVGNLINRSKFDINKKYNKFMEDYVPLVEEFTKKYKNYDALLQVDENGKPTGYIINKYSDEYYKKAKGNRKFFKQNTTLEVTKEGFDKYEIDKKIAQEVSPTDEDYFNWLRENDPNLYLKNVKDGKKSSPKLYSNVQKYIKATINDKWIDPKYKALMSLGEEDPAVKFYNFIEPILRGLNQLHGQQINYIPEMHKTVGEYLTKGKLKKAAIKAKKDILPDFSKKEGSKEGSISTLTGELKSSIVVNMFSNNLEAEDKSYNLAHIIESVKYQQFNIDAKHEIEPLLNIYYHLIANSNERSKKVDKDGNAIILEKAPKRILDQTRYVIEAYLYSKNTKDEGLAGEITDKLIAYTRLNGMAFNLFSAGGNIIQGLMSNYTYSVGGGPFTQKEYFKATSLMLNVIAGDKKIAKKIAMFVDKFDTFVKNTELNYGMSKQLENAVKSFGSDVNPYFMQTYGEYFIQGQTTIAMLLNNKITNSDGTKSTIFESFDENGKWINEKAENPFENDMNLFKMTQKIRKSIYDVHGNYGESIKAKEHFYSRALMIFRTWLPQAIETRFGEEKTDFLLDEKRKGRYRSYGLFGGNNNFLRNEDGKIDLDQIKDNLTWLIGLNKNNKLSELDKTNLKKNMGELAMLTAFTIFILMLKSGLKDLDDDERRVTTYILNSMMRAQSDLTFFMSPASFDQIMKDPIPLTSVLKNVIDLNGAAFATITGNGIYKTGSRKGKSKLGKEFGDLFPIINQIPKNLNYAEQLF